MDITQESTKKRSQRTPVRTWKGSVVVRMLKWCNSLLHFFLAKSCLKFHYRKCRTRKCCVILTESYFLINWFKQISKSIIVSILCTLLNFYHFALFSFLTLFFTKTPTPPIFDISERIRSGVLINFLWVFYMNDPLFLLFGGDSGKVDQFDSCHNSYMRHYQLKLQNKRNSKMLIWSFDLLLNFSMNKKH
jgi:hypothetical protein